MDTLGELFETLDAAPHHERDLDAHAEQFLVSWAQGIPRDAPLRLSIQVSKWPADVPAAASIESAVRHHFLELERLMREEFRSLMREGRIALGIGVAFLIVCVTAGNALAGLLHDATWADIARETLSIGGWVAMWRPMQIYLYDWWPIKTRERLYRRMARMHVRLRQPRRNAAKPMTEPAVAPSAATRH